jgi:2,3-bisphosphoglycerate-dependent phosphoglycerate mutase
MYDIIFSMYTLILLRHGQSVWNLENRFTGWIDVDLSEQGRQEAKQAGQKILEASLTPKAAFSSYLRRAINTLNIALDVMNLHYIDVFKSWRLNERHYGALQGLNKKEMIKLHGEEQVNIWRRSYDVPPPSLSKDDPNHPCNDPKYKYVRCQDLPSSESLKDTLKRTLPYFQDAIAPNLFQRGCVLVVAHGNSIRAIVKYLENLTDEEIVKLNIPTGIPLVYTVDEHLDIKSKRYLADEETLKNAVESVANQTKA